MTILVNLHNICPACDSSVVKTSTWLYSPDLLKCNQCGLVFDKRIPSTQELTEHYSTYSYSGRKPVPTATKLSFDNLLDKFEPYRKFNNILDVGCGQGDFLLAAQARGWNVYGSEYSPAAVRLCKVG
jgi:2-polyprenyl-3-methyl-5-hydroxy-6-metoxy-1,4-benzoquinol methylase